MNKFKGKQNYIKSICGFTLIEVIVSLAIFTFITVGFFGVFATVFINMYNTSQVTENVFDSKRELELKITDVKEKIDNNLLDDIPDESNLITEKSFVLFAGTPNEVTIDAYEIKSEIGNGQQLETVIAQNRPPKLITPNINSPIWIDIIDVTNSNTVVKYPNIADKDKYDLILKNGTPDVDEPGYLIQFLYYWYISKPGFYTPYREPVFPSDYEILTGYTSKDISTIVDSFGGRFLKLVVTPVGEKGAMGISEESNAVYISKLPVINNLQLHLDSSFIHHVIDSTDDGSNIFVNNWNNIAPNYSSTSTSNPLAIDGSIFKPSLIFSQVNEQNIINTVSNDNLTYTTFTTSYNPSNTLSSREKTIYFAIYLEPDVIVQDNIQVFNSSGNSRLMVKTSVINNEVKLVLIRHLNSSTNFRTVTTQKSLELGKWNLVRMNLNNDQLAISNTLLDTDGSFSFDSNSSTNFTPTITSNVSILPFSLGLIEGYSLGEVLIYNGRMSDQNNNLVLEYLFEKYTP